MRKSLVSLILCLPSLCAGPALAEMWETYSPSKHVFSIFRIKVQSNRLDDYLDGLRKTYVPKMEVAKKDGSLVDYKIMLNTSRESDANVVIIEEYSSWEAVAPNKERDLKARAEYRAILPKEDSEKIVDEYNKYRTFLDEGLYRSTEFTK